MKTNKKKETLKQIIEMCFYTHSKNTFTGEIETINVPIALNRIAEALKEIAYVLKKPEEDY